MVRRLRRIKEALILVFWNANSHAIYNAVCELSGEFISWYVFVGDSMKRSIRQPQCFIKLLTFRMICGQLKFSRIRAKLGVLKAYRGEDLRQISLKNAKNSAH